ncbi:MAG TPA: DeoR/GlpR transcriptional regulator [Lentisphaeria bacterium]|nr:MAG: DeoR family transcriptional regulator [Lentisphaerae bacterium GWF2_38_69]HBM16666.1 DeoR/GlpR transcriptional regulator [Lentisphaeria bacterium]
MLGAERRHLVIEKIRMNKKVYVNELSELFNITEETVRRDLEKLESEGILKRTYGGAVAFQEISEDLPFVARFMQNPEAKKVIAQKAAALIKDGDKLVVDASSTSYLLLDKIKNKKNITLITNSIRIPYDFSDSEMQIISTGGELRHNSMALAGANAKKSLQNYHADTAILSCKALSIEKGIMESNEPESDLKSAMRHQSEKCVLLADSSKFGKVAFLKMLDFKDIDYLITDKDPGKNWQEFCIKADIELIF